MQNRCSEAEDIHELEPAKSSKFRAGLYEFGHLPHYFDECLMTGIVFLAVQDKRDVAQIVNAYIICVGEEVVRKGEGIKEPDSAALIVVWCEVFVG